MTAPFCSAPPQTSTSGNYGRRETISGVPVMTRCSAVLCHYDVDALEAEFTCRRCDRTWTAPLGIRSAIDDLVHQRDAALLDAAAARNANPPPQKLRDELGAAEKEVRRLRAELAIATTTVESQRGYVRQALEERDQALARIDELEHEAGIAPENRTVRP